MHSFTFSGSVTLQVYAFARTPYSAAIFSATGVPSFKSKIAISAPASAMYAATVSPIPWFPPVTTQTFPFN